jgi:hypothetical protein
VTPGDDELLARAQVGDVGAFAALVHRYAPTVHAAARARGEADPDAVVVTTLRRAMRQLDRAPADDVAGWLVGLSVPRRRRDDTVELPDADTVSPLTDRTVDGIWAALAPRWPSGRRPVGLPRWVGQVALVALLLVLSVAVPYVLLVTAAEESEDPGPIAEVIAEPVEDDDVWSVEPDGDVDG